MSDNPREVIDLSGHNNTIESLILDNKKQYLYYLLTKDIKVMKI